MSLGGLAVLATHAAAVIALAAAPFDNLEK
jgi:hypothetical protein